MSRTGAYVAAVEYVAKICTPAEKLAEATGLSQGEFDRLKEAGVVPAPTYTVTARRVVSAVADLGEALADADSAGVTEIGQGYFGPAVPVWLRRAAVMATGLEDGGLQARLQRWLADDMAAILEARAAEARDLGWSHVFTDGRLDPAKLQTEAQVHWEDWMNGGWAICLRQFDGHHLVTKEVERARITRLTGGGERPDLSPDERLKLIDAMSRLDAVILPFAPHERPLGTPGRFIDAPARQYGLPWAPPDA